MSAKLVFVQFRSPVSVGGKFSSLEYWSSEKHAGVIDAVEKGSWVVLSLENGDKRRVPMHNVSYLSDREVDDVPR